MRSLIEIIEGTSLIEPCMVEGCLGRIHFRGGTVPLLDVRKRFGIGGRSSETGSAVVVSIGARKVAIPVDGISGVRDVGAGIPFPQVILREKGIFPILYDVDGELVAGVDLTSLFREEFLETLPFTSMGRETPA